MDELLIDEKKYLSTKRAAKVTGYAKDYIGQLCREGRVKARHVGRSWYVLEADIRQHRFGAAEAGPPSISLPKANEPKKEEPEADHSEKKTEKSIDRAWESPRYTPEYAEPPQINLLKKHQAVESTAQGATTEVTEAPSAHNEPLDNLNEAWEAWFSNNQNRPQASAVEESALVKDAGPSLQDPAKSETENRAENASGIHQPDETQQEPSAPEESVPIIRKTEPLAYPQRAEALREPLVRGQRDREMLQAVAGPNRRHRSSPGTKAIRLVCVILAVGALGLACLQFDYTLTSKLPTVARRAAGWTTYEMSLKP